MEDNDTYRILRFNDIFNDELHDNSDKYIDRILNFTLCDPTHFIELHEDPRPPPKPPDITNTSMLPTQILEKAYNEEKKILSTPENHIKNGKIIRIQADGGANRSVTNHYNIMNSIWEIKPHYIGGICSGIQCTHKGIYKLLSDDDTILNVEMFYSKEATETVISPTDIVMTNNMFNSWSQTANCSTKTGNLKFYSTKQKLQCNISLVMINKLWYIRPQIRNFHEVALIHTLTADTINTVNGTALYRLWHHRLGHPGKFVMDNIKAVTDGVPKLKHLRNPFFKCEHSMHGKITQMKKGFNEDPTRATVPGQRFFMDYGFIRAHTEEGKILQSIDNYTTYLLIADEYSRYMWVFLFKSKHPQIQIIKDFLDQQGATTKTKWVRTDQGGELGRSKIFQKTVQECKFLLEPTGAGASFQNAIVERGHRSLGNMVRTLLSSANLKPEYWSFAILHAVYIKNRLPHQSLPNHKTPIEQYTGRRPNLEHLRVFGSRVIVKQPHIRRGKIDDSYTTTGIFLHYNATTRNITYIDNITKEIKIARHVVFDEAHFAVDDRPPYAKELMNISENHINNKNLDKITNVEETTTLPPQIILSRSFYGSTLDTSVKLWGTHKHLGMNLELDNDKNRIILISCEPSTPANRIPKWRSVLRNGVLLEANGIIIDDLQHLENIITKARSDQQKHIILTFAPMEKQHERVEDGCPQIHFDQFNVMAYQHNATRENKPPWKDPHNGPPMEEDSILAAIANGNIPHKLTRSYLHKQPDWDEWRQAEHKMLNTYASQDMFGLPIQPPPNANILPFIWTYLVKQDGTKKARCCVNGNPKRKGTVTLDHTYAAALDQAGARVFWALAALYGYVVYGADATNAFAEAPPPKAPLYVIVDKQYQDWWMNVTKQAPIPKGYVLPVKHALQGHPESPRLWAKKIHDIFTNIGFKNTTHEPCIYTGIFKGNRLFLLRQVDDFALAAPLQQTANEIFEQIQHFLTQPLHILNQLTMYNGLNVQQTKHFIKISCTTYLEKILQGKEWSNEGKNTVIKTPMHHDKKILTSLEHAEGPTDTNEQIQLQQSMKFSYRQAIGELIFAAITCRPDILYAVIKLSQYSNNPHQDHYIAVKRIYKYLRSTIHEGLHFWRNNEHPLLPHTTLTPTINETHQVQLPQHDTFDAHGFVDADWSGDTKHRRSMTGFSIFLAGAPVIYKAKFQPTISLSSTESKFMSATEAAKAAKYLRTILNELGHFQNSATTLYEDNNAAIAMANAQRPTRRTRHMDIRHFALLQWVELDEIVLSYISTSDNPADGFTKPLGPTLFSRHATTLLGKRKPHYCAF